MCPSIPPSPSVEELMRDAIGRAQAGRMQEAVELLRRALAADPAHAGANGLMGTLLHAMGRGAEAVLYLERAHAAAPNEARLAYQLGAVLASLGQSSRGLGLMRRAVELDPAWVQGMNGLGNALYAAGDLEGADGAYRRSLAVQPGQADALCGLAGILIVSGKPSEAAGLFREAGRLHPANAEVLGKLLSALNYAEDAGPEETFAAHAAWGNAVMGEGPRPEARGLSETGRAPEKRLRVGLLSPDLYDHSCAYFLRSFLKHRDRGSYEVVCYSSAGRSDWMTSQLQAMADQWQDVAGMSEAKLIETIRADGVDVLLELAGHTALGPLAALRNRAAPVQATYLGYPNTTGLPTMDWRIVDETTDPPGAEAWHTERLARLRGCFVCYTAPDGAPEVRATDRGSSTIGAPSAAPIAPSGDRWHITFGSFNSIRKLSPGAVRVWSRVLKEVPGSRLLLKTRGLDSPFAQRNIHEQFGAHGVGPERVDMAAMVPSKPDHLGWYHRVDVGLDTFPYNGTTTTCEALWMGVPVVTLMGKMHAGRVGASVLAAAGMPELIAASEDKYVAIAAGLARDGARLSALRKGMRTRLSGSSLMDGPGHAGRFFAAVRGMWREWCQRAGR